jgi:hypothetical protein
VCGGPGSTRLHRTCSCSERGLGFGAIGKGLPGRISFHGPGRNGRARGVREKQAIQLHRQRHGYGLDSPTRQRAILANWRTAELANWRTGEPANWRTGEPAKARLPAFGGRPWPCEGAAIVLKCSEENT